MSDCFLTRLKIRQIFNFPKILFLTFEGLIRSDGKTGVSCEVQETFIRRFFHQQLEGRFSDSVLMSVKFLVKVLVTGAHAAADPDGFCGVWVVRSVEKRLRL